MRGNANLLVARGVAGIAQVKALDRDASPLGFDQSAADSKRPTGVGRADCPLVKGLYRVQVRSRQQR